jgi:large subunit ribosomal protein LP2
MKYVAAYCLAVLSGNNSPSADDVKKILSSVGVEVDADKLSGLLNSLKGKNIHEVNYIIFFNKKVIASGLTKVSTMSFGGSSSAANTTTAPAKVEEKAAAKKVVEEVKVEEEDVDMGGLFDF